MAVNDLPVFMDDDLKAWYGITDEDTLEDKLNKLIEKGMDVSELADLVDDPTLKERVLKTEIKTNSEVKEGVDVNGTPYVSVVEAEKGTEKLDEKIQKEDTVSSFCFRPTEQRYLPSPSSTSPSSTSPSSTTSSSTSSSTSTWASSSSSSSYSYGSSSSNSYSQYQKTNEAVSNSSFNLDARSRLERLRKRAIEENREKIEKEELKITNNNYSRKAKVGFALMNAEKIVKKTSICIFIVCAETAVTVLTNSGKVLVERLSNQVADSILKGGIIKC